MKITIIVLAVLAVVGLGVWWEVYKYHDCKMVGHSTLYCVLKINS
jgi:hypothetical protein